ncbi:MAG: phosphoribosylglycinamide formyltransferase [Deltaproteobacteria bacterium]|nr:phosphoribosylglycinamide formyltransferase [Deltaproteobacteria bacterium]
MTKPDALRVAVLLSGEGTSLENLFEQIESGALGARIVAVISSKEHAGGLERARRHGVPALAVPRKQYPDPGDFNDAIHTELDRHEVDLVACLGFLSPFETRGKFDGRAINVHPALIPAFCGKGFYGQRVHEAVLAAGEPITGATVHFIDDEYDSGPIILQEEITVRPDDTPASLAERVQAIERRLVPKAIQLFANHQLTLKDQKVQIHPSPSS